MTDLELLTAMRTQVEALQEKVEQLEEMRARHAWQDQETAFVDLGEVTYRCHPAIKEALRLARGRICSLVGELEGKNHNRLDQLEADYAGQKTRLDHLQAEVDLQLARRTRAWLLAAELAKLLQVNT